MTDKKDKVEKTEKPAKTAKTDKTEKTQKISSKVDAPVQAAKAEPKTAAAKQAVLFGIKGIALSTPVGKTEPDFEALEPFVEKTLALLLEDKELALYNVNFPEKPKEIIWTRQSVRLYDGTIIPGTDPLGRKHYWFTVSPLEPADEGTDRWAVENDMVSITPLRLDLTDEATLLKKQEENR